VSPVLLYWLLVGLAVIVTVGVVAVTSGAQALNNPADLLAAGFFVSVMLLPGLQLIASLVALVVVAIFYPERGYALRRLGRITLYCFFGTLLGVMLMGGCLGALFFSR